jgi:uncharacterized protein YkwD
MKRINIILGLLIVLVASAGVLVATNKPSQPQVRAAVQEKPLLEQINAVRASVGKPALVEDPKLNQAAQMKVDDQVTRNYWKHHLDGEATFKFVSPLYPGQILPGDENLAKCQTSDSQRVDNWVHSPAHYAAMIGDFTAFGYAEKVNPKDNNCVYTVTYFLNE